MNKRYWKIQYPNFSELDYDSIRCAGRRTTVDGNYEYGELWLTKEDFKWYDKRYETDRFESMKIEWLDEETTGQSGKYLSPDAGHVYDYEEIKDHPQFGLFKRLDAEQFIEKIQELERENVRLKGALFMAQLEISKETSEYALKEARIKELEEEYEKLKREAERYQQKIRDLNSLLKSKTP
jgi:hypothetical protein